LTTHHPNLSFYVGLRETYTICNFLANCCDYTRKQYKTLISLSPEVYETSSKTRSRIRILYLLTGPIKATYPGTRRLTDAPGAVSGSDVPCCCGALAVCCSPSYDCGGVANTNPTTTFHSMTSGLSIHQSRANSPLPASVTALADSPELCNQHAASCSTTTTILLHHHFTAVIQDNLPSVL